MANNSEFTNLLKELLARCCDENLSDPELATRLRVQVEDVQKWKLGRTTPREYQLERLVAYLQEQCSESSESVENEILQLYESCGYSITSSVNRTTIGDRNSQFVETDEYTSAILRMSSQSEAMSRNIERLQHQIDTLIEIPGEGDYREIVEVLQAQLDELKKQIPNVDILFPRKIKIRLVRSDALTELDYLSREENQLWAVIGITSGAVLGFFVNWLTNSSSSLSSALIVLAILILVTMAATLWLRQVKGQITKNRGRLLGGELEES